MDKQQAIAMAVITVKELMASTEWREYFQFIQSRTEGDTIVLGDGDKERLDVLARAFQRKQMELIFRET